MSNIGIVVLATNAYFVLGIRFIKKFMHHYKGESKIKFYIFSDDNPTTYLPDDFNFDWYYDKHDNWVDGTNSKFKNIVSLENCDSDYLYYFDADTNISKNFTEKWFLGDLVGGEHYGNKSWLANGNGFDKNPQSKAYVNPNSELPKTYYYGAFFGGKKDRVIDFCKTLKEWQLEDKQIPYEPGVNDESYINAYFHYNLPMIVPCEKFEFEISHKGGIGETRDTKLNITKLKNDMLINKNNVIDILNGEVKIW
jgi:hypothetical protein